MLKLNQVYNFDVMSGLKELSSESVDMVLTSPPYWSMRDYGKAATAIWGGDEKYEYDFSEKVITKRESGTSKTAQVGNHKKKFADFNYVSQFCQKCGAWRGQLGLEPSIDSYIEHLVGVFDETHRVLKKTGTCWVNLGDTYYTNAAGAYSHDKVVSQKWIEATGLNKVSALRNQGELPPKCLSMIPFRLAMAMVKRGWLLRNVIIWHKPNCIPELRLSSIVTGVLPMNAPSAVTFAPVGVDETLIDCVVPRVIVAQPPMAKPETSNPNVKNTFFIIFALSVNL